MECWENLTELFSQVALPQLSDALSVLCIEHGYLILNIYTTVFAFTP